MTHRYTSVLMFLLLLAASSATARRSASGSDSTLAPLKAGCARLRSSHTAALLMMRSPL